MRPVLVLFALVTAAACQPVPDALRAEVMGTLPAGNYRLVKSWQVEEASHQTGAFIDDPTASGGRCLDLVNGRDVTEKAALYGPYAEVPAGDYAALVRLKLPVATDDDTLARLDACVGMGDEALTTRELLVSDLQPGTWVRVPLFFHNPGGKLEVRVFWSAAAPLRIDGVDLFAFDGTLPPSAGRVPQPASSGQPRNLPYHFEPATPLLPQSQPLGDKLVTFDLRPQPLDARHLVLSLQGLVNRAQPQLYCFTDPTDEQWLTCLRDRAGVKTTEAVADLDALVARYKSSIKGFVLTDPKLPATRNIALMLASTKDALVATPRLAKRYPDLPVLDDLRGKFTGNVAAYKWAFDTLWPKLTHQTAACLWPDDASGLRDYLYQHKVFTFWLSGQIDGARPGHDANGEVRLIEQVLAKMPPNTPFLGYPWAGKDIGIGEHDGVQLFAQFGHYLVGSVGLSNISVHSGAKLPPLHQDAGPTPTLDTSKVYVTWLMSDGDNLPVLSKGNFPQLWSDPARGKMPMAWTISPAAPLLMPAVVDYYYRTASPGDAWVGAVSGIGYTYPDDYGQRYAGAGRQQSFDDFLKQTNDHFGALDLKQIWIMGIRDPALIARYARLIPRLNAIFPDYGRVVSRYDDAFYPTDRGIPVFHAAMGWEEKDSREQRIERYVRDIKAFTPTQRPAFLHLFIWNWGADLPMVQEVQKRLGADYVPVRPEHLAAMARQQLDKDGALVRVPSTITGFLGKPLALDASVQNVTRGELAVKLAASGLDGATVTPATLKLAPNQVATATVRGRVGTAPLTVTVSGAFGQTERQVNVRQLNPDELLRPLTQETRPVVDFEAVNLAHRSGAAATLEGSLAKQVWVAKAGTTEAGHICFGPYEALPAGRYVAFFRLQRTGDGDGELVTLDTHVGGGGDLAVLHVNVAGFPKGRWMLLPIEFKHPGGTLETRVLWPGKADVAIDTIVVHKLAP